MSSDLNARAKALYSYIDAATIDLLIEAQADAVLIDLLRRGLGTRDGMEVRWAR